MALEKTFREFCTALQKLRDRVGELRLTVVVDRPSKNDAVVVDNLEYGVEDMLGWLNETIAAAKAAERAAGHPLDLEQARHALTTCQERFQRIEQVFSTNLVSYERMKDLTSFGSERRGEWPSWVTSVKQGIDHCRQPIEETRNYLAACWQEIAERVGMTSISVRTTNIGQKITTSAAEQIDSVKVGIT
jgi:hypothetical protein